MLKSVTEFWKNKSIKLSDSFEVLITFKNGKEPTSLYNCTGFTIPKLEYEEEVLSYGNLAQVFQTPKYDSCKELTLEFTEMMDKTKKTDKEKNMVVLSKVFEYMGFDTKQLFANGGLQSNSATYSFDKIIPTIEIKILNNKLWRYKYKYHFGNLKIVNYSIYNLDYQNESPCKVGVTLSFETYRKEVINENVKYNINEIKNTPKPPQTKEDIENYFKQSTNQSDLDMIKAEQLYNPAFGELPDLDDDDNDTSISNPPLQETQVASNEYLGQRTGGYRGPQRPITNQNPTRIENITVNNSNTELSTNEVDIKEMAQRAVKFDRQAGVPKG